jgi:hypothetical protein
MWQCSTGTDVSICLAEHCAQLRVIVVTVKGEEGCVDEIVEGWKETLYSVVGDVWLQYMATSDFTHQLHPTLATVFALGLLAIAVVGGGA